MKKILFAFLVIALAGSCFAASIDVKEKVAAETVWSFSVTLPPAEEFSDADVFLNGNRIMSFYTYNDKIKFDEEDIETSRVFSSPRLDGRKAYFLAVPLSKGMHEIALEVDDEEADRKEVEFFEIYDADESADLETQVNSVRNTANTLLNQVADLEEKMGKALTEEDRQALQTSIDSVKSSVSSLESSLENQEANTGLKIDALAQDLESLQGRTDDLNKSVTSGTALFSLFNLDSGVGMAVAFVAIALVVALALIRYKDRLPRLKTGLYGRQNKDSEFTERDEEIAGQVLTESQDESHQGKWAYGGFKQQPKQEEAKRFNIGDLIRK